MAVSGLDVLDNWDTWGVFLLLSGVNLVVVLLRTRWGARIGPPVRAFLRRVSGRSDLRWLDWRLPLVLGALWFGGFAADGILTGQFACRPTTLNDVAGELSSGLAFWRGQNPFAGVPYCGTTIDVPYGLPALLLDALGSLGGAAGICAVWGAVALSLLPLTWAAGGSDRRYITAYVATSVLCIPLVTSELGGATNAIVPVTLLLALYLAGRGERVASVVSGVLATARFPTVFPALARTGTAGARRFASFALVAASFGAVTLATYAVWGEGFLRSVFLDQFERRSFSLNLYGILLLHNALPTSLAIEAAQAAFTLGLVVAVFFLVRSPVRAVAITLVGVALVTPFLSYNILVWLLPVALVGARPRAWLWGIATVGSVNFGLGFDYFAWSQGVLWPAELLDVVMTALLVLLFVDLWRDARRTPDRPPDALSDASGSATDPARPSSARTGASDRWST